MIEATGSLEMDIGQLRTTNERDERTLESLFEQKHSRLKLKTDLETQLTVCSCNIRTILVYTVLIYWNLNSFTLYRGSFSIYRRRSSMWLRWWLECPLQCDKSRISNIICELIISFVLSLNTFLALCKGTRRRALATKNCKRHTRREVESWKRRARGARSS